MTTRSLGLSDEIYTVSLLSWLLLASGAAMDLLTINSIAQGQFESEPTGKSEAPGQSGPSTSKFGRASHHRAKSKSRDGFIYGLAANIGMWISSLSNLLALGIRI
jgi:hypothetical protein